MRKVKLEQRFWKYVQKDVTCWLWTGARKTTGYGEIGGGGGKTLAAHRVSWTLHYGEIPEERCVCHTCDVPLCVNPAHLFLGTQKDNYDDSVSKGRAYGHRAIDIFKKLEKKRKRDAAIKRVYRRGRTSHQKFLASVFDRMADGESKYGLSSKLASLLGVSRQALEQWRSGKAKIPEKRVAQIEALESLATKGTVTKAELKRRPA